ncbi:hypothetical protein, partial [Peribacillus frigoritolerans]|uniref:hypothetical protein n=1 Tax=Peribacillus frigoritolerans TaxID=450367 RepID=UPI00227F7172
GCEFNWEAVEGAAFFFCVGATAIRDADDSNAHLMDFVSFRNILFVSIMVIVYNVERSDF